VPGKGNPSETGAIGASSVTLPTVFTCRLCNGKPSDFRECPSCYGDGYIDDDEECPDCIDGESGDWCECCGTSGEHVSGVCLADLRGAL
jgi:hypothetical protein